MPKYMPERRFSFISNSSSLNQDTFGVVQFSGVEGISLPYEFEIMLVSDSTDIDLDEVMAYPAKFTIHRKNGDDVDFHGILNSFEQLHKYNEYVFYRAHLVPRLWWLSITHHNQVCLNKSVPEIIALALKDSGLTKLDFEFKTRNTYKPIDYVCQYNESHFNFISRWLEREGLYYYFDQKGPAEKIIFTDTNIAHTNLPDVSYAPPEGLLEDENVEIVNSFTCRQRQLPQKIFLKDYNYQRPSLGISGSADVDSKGRGTDYIYGEYFETSEEGDRLAGIRAEILNCRRREFIGESTIPFIEPGYTFTLSNHYRESFNQQYLVESISHEGNQMGYLLPSIAEGVPGYKHTIYYRNSFTTIPSNVQFRAEKKSTRPYISGTLHAKVDAEGSGKYAELDDQGRYKVRLPFDESDNHKSGKASTWLRMMQPYANQAGGMQFPLTKGTEVLLTFIDGDPDRPVIAGAIANPETPSPVSAKNQTESVIQTGGNNKIRMEDLEGKERIIMETPTAGTWIRLGAHNDPPSSWDVAIGEDITTYEDGTGTWSLDNKTIASATISGTRVNYYRKKRYVVERTETQSLQGGSFYKFKINDNQIYPLEGVTNNDNPTIPSGTRVTIENELFTVESGTQDFSSGECELAFKSVRTVQVVLNVFDPMIIRNESNGIRIRTDGQYWLESSGLFGEYVGGLPSETQCPNGKIKDLRNKVYNQNWQKPSESLDVLRPIGISDSAAGFTNDMKFLSSDTQNNKDDKNKKRWQYFLDNAQVRFIEGDVLNIQNGCQYDLTGNTYAFAGGIYNEQHISWDPEFNKQFSIEADKTRAGTAIAGIVIGNVVSVAASTVSIPIKYAAISGVATACASTDPIAGALTASAVIAGIASILSMVVGVSVGASQTVIGKNVGDLIPGPSADNDISGMDIKSWAEKVRSSIKKEDGKWVQSSDIYEKNEFMKPETTWVEKSFGDTYDFQRGNGIEVKVGQFESHTKGDSYEFHYGGTQESREYTEGGKLLTHEKKDANGAGSTAKYDPLTGNLSNYEFDYGGFGFVYNTPTLPTLKIEVNTGILDTTLKIDASTKLDVNVSATLDTTVDVGAGLSTKILYKKGGELTYNGITKKVKYEGFNLETEGNEKVEVELQKLPSIKKANANIAKVETKLHDIGIEIKNLKTKISQGLHIHT